MSQKMGKNPNNKKKKQGVSTGLADPTLGRRSNQSSPKALDEDMNVFIDMSHNLKDEGNQLFQHRDYEAAILKYEKAIKLLPRGHLDVAYLRSNLAACYMQMGPEEYHRALEECNMALEISPKYSKALIKRARCFEALNRLESAFKDVDLVLSLEPNNLTALEIMQRVKAVLDKKDTKLDSNLLDSTREQVVAKGKKKKKSHKTEGKVKIEDKLIVEKCGHVNDKAKKEEDYNYVKEETGSVKELMLKPVKIVLGEDIRWAQIPSDCSMLQLRDIVLSRFPMLNSIVVKYKDNEGDMVTITSSEELQWAEESSDPQGSVRLYIAEVDPALDPFFEGNRKSPVIEVQEKNRSGIAENWSMRYDDDKSTTSHVDDWIVQFARLFKNHVGFDTDGPLDLHNFGMKLYSEAMEDTVTSEEAQDLLDIAANKFREMAALALFNCGNVHMSRARKFLFLSEETSRESLLANVKTAYEWAQGEYIKSGKRYEEALEIKPNFFEGIIALGLQQFEQAKLSWYFSIASKVDMEMQPSSEVLELFNNAEDNMERGTKMWEEMELQRLKSIGKPDREKLLLQTVGLDGLVKELTTDEAAEMASNMRSQINILWGTMLYERSVVEFKIGLPLWQECLADSVEKFKLGGASPADIAVMIKNHCSNESSQEGLSFKIDEIVDAWNEMYDAKRWISGVPSFRLEPLLHRRVPKLHHLLEYL